MFENALDLTTKYSSDKFIIFTHSKKMGHSMLQMLQDNSIFADFHNADLLKEIDNPLFVLLLIPFIFL